MRYGSATAASLAFALSALALTTGAAGTEAAQAARPTLPADLTAVRAALDKYQDPIAAVRDGYLSTVGCIDYP